MYGQPTKREETPYVEFVNLRNDAQLHIPFVRFATFTIFPSIRHWREFPIVELKTTTSRLLFLKVGREHFFYNLK